MANKMTELEKDIYPSYYKEFQRDLDIDWITVVRKRKPNHMISETIGTFVYKNTILKILGLFETSEIMNSSNEN